MTAAKESTLGELHNKMAVVMGKALDQLEVQQDMYGNQLREAIDNNDPDMMPSAEPNLNPALLSVIARFLDSNKITCVPETGNAMGALEAKLEAKRHKREQKLKVVGGTSHDIDD